MHTRLFTARGALALLTACSDGSASVLERRQTPPSGSASATSTANSNSVASSAPTSDVLASSSSLVASATESTAPTNLDASASASTSVSASSTGTDSESPPLPTSTSKSKLPPGVPVCDEAPTEQNPFCSPKNMTDVLVDDTYYVTWHSSAFRPNSTIVLFVNYANTSSSFAGREAWHSEKTPNGYGFASMTMDAAWLKDRKRNNLTILAQEIENDAAGVAGKSTWHVGPTVSLTTPPVQHYPPSPETPPPTKLGLMVGLPIALASVFIIMCGLAWGMRKTRRLGVGNVMGRRRGYGVGKSRRQRLRGIRLDDTVTAPTGSRAADDLEGRDKAAASSLGGFRDEPVGGGVGGGTVRGRERDDSLGSLADAVGAHHDYSDEPPRERTNTFRDEVARQERQHTGRHGP
ncbi:MAG: hypothetical protein M1825_000593 [Sarcosagium campestre]|nr:MAG: hypothetical protein M1825_000593 [Sarcosagium campestre]